MRLARLRSALLAAAFSLGVAAAGQTPPAASAAPKPFEDVIRLHAAGLSEDFIVRKIARDGVVYDLSTDDVIACKKAGLPEPLIEAMLKTGPKPAGSPAPAATPAPSAPAAAVAPVAPVGAASAPVAAAPALAPVAAPTVPVATAGPSAPAPPSGAAPAETPVPAPSPAPPPLPTPDPAPALPAVAAPVVVAAPAPVPAPAPGAAPTSVSFPERTFDGLVRRVPGVVLFKDPWEPGTLSFREGTLTWTDASDPARSVVVAAAELTEQFLVCPKETDWDGACWEWGVKTASAEHRFREETWETRTGPSPAEIHALVKAAMPSLAVARYRASKKK